MQKNYILNSNNSRRGRTFHSGKQPIEQSTIFQGEDKHHYVALHSNVPRLSCASVLALDIGKYSIEGFDGRKHYKFSPDRPEEILRLKPTTVFLESTGVYHRPITKKLLSKNVVVYEVNTRRLAKFRSQFTEDVKTDSKDVELIWNFGKMFKHKRITSVSNYYEPLLRRYRILSESVSKWRIFLEPARINGEEESITFFKDQISLFQAEKRKIRKNLGEVLPEVLVKEYGTLLTATLLAMQPHKFPTSKQWASYLGFKLIQYESGTIVRTRRLSKRGNVEARYLLYLCLMGKLRFKKEPYFGYFQRLKGRGVLGRKVMVAGMRKMTRRFWAQARDLRHGL